MKRTTHSVLATVAVLIAGGLAGQALAADDMKTVAISTIVEVPALTDTRDGVLQGLADRGYKEGENLRIDYQNANGNMPTQQQIAKKFAGDAPDVIVAITTPTSQAMISTIEDIPIVFTTVTDPLKAKLIPQFKQPGGNVTGVSDAAPIGQQLDLIRELLPEIDQIGFVYNPGLDNALSALELIRREGESRGIEVIESPSPTTNEVIPATRKLVGKVDAIYVPNDTTVVAALEAIVKVGQDTKTPIFTGETGGVERGAAASVGLDYVAVGRTTGEMVADVLEGKSPGQIDAVIAYEVHDDFKLLVNKQSAEAMGIDVPQSVLDRAEMVGE